MKHIGYIILAFAAAFAATRADAAGKDVLLPYGDMNRWTIRHVKESGVIGGDTKTLYEVGPTARLRGTSPTSTAAARPGARRT